MNKTALITGASSGIGQALAIEAAKRGYNLGLMARDAAKLDFTVNQCRKEGIKVYSFIGDISSENDCKHFVDGAQKELGDINVLINNAGISMRAKFHGIDLGVLKKTMDTNFWGTVYCTNFALDSLLRSKGSVVAISSIAGFKGLPARTGYSASKFAIHGFLESLRIENLKTGLHVLIACPGYTASNIRNAALNASGQAQGETPLDEKKLMQPAIVAAKVWTAIEKRKNYLVLTLQGKLTVWLNKWASSLVDKLTFKVISREKDSPF